MKKSKSLIVRKIGSTLFIGKKAYQYSGKAPNGLMEFKEVPATREVSVLIENLVEKLEPAVDKKIILKDALYELPIKQLRNISRILKKKKPKLKTTGGCVELRIGKEVIDLR